MGGFSGLDMTPAGALAYVAAMQEHGVSVTYAHLADPHDPPTGAGPLRPGVSPASTAPWVIIPPTWGPRPAMPRGGDDSHR